MQMVSRSFTSKDLKYYYFYYRIGCKNKKCPECGVRQETEIFHHVFDGEIIVKAEKILRRKINELRFKDYEHASRVCAAAVCYFYPQTHKVGRVVASWNRADLEQLLPVKRKSKIVWYFVHGTVNYPDKDGEFSDHDFQSKSFPATTLQEAEEKAYQWLKRFEKTLKNKKSICHCEASLHYANRNRGSFSLPGTNGNLLKKFIISK